jgi:hypothetical protein
MLPYCLRELPKLVVRERDILGISGTEFGQNHVAFARRAVFLRRRDIVVNALLA